MPIYTDTLPKDTAEVIEKIKNLKDLNPFYLSGGTALSLQIGHRESEDLDFFNAEEFEPSDLQQSFQDVGSLSDIQKEKGTLNLYVDGVKLQFLHYPYSLLEDTVHWNGLRLSSIIDIACTKLITISERGGKKDFIDLYHILKIYSLSELFGSLESKYEGIRYNRTHILISLLFFTDADEQPIPRMHTDVTWDAIKDEITKKVKKFSF